MTDDAATAASLLRLRAWDRPQIKPENDARRFQAVLGTRGGGFLKKCCCCHARPCHDMPTQLASFLCRAAFPPHHNIRQRRNRAQAAGARDRRRPPQSGNKQRPRATAATAAAMTSASAPACASPRQQLGPLQQFLAAAALGIFVGSIAAAVLLALTTTALLLTSPLSPVGWTLLALLVALTYWPLPERNSRLGDALMTYACSRAGPYFPTTVVVEEGAQFKRDVPYIVGLEPHSALPTAMPAVFGLQSPLLPEALRGRTHGLASSVCFQVPLVRHVYHWIGLRPITRGVMRSLLGARRSVVLIPGGVQECVHMAKGRETVFLRSRKGFVRLAMQAGAQLVPCFAFGQSDTYAWYRPGPPLLPEALVQALSRQIGMVPLLMVGRAGTVAPINAPMTVVFGRPIEVPRMDSPPEELLQQYLDVFIADMQALFEKHKAAAGYPDHQLVVL